MAFDDTELHRPFTLEERRAGRQLSPADVKCIDDCLLSHAPHPWGKVARVIGPGNLRISRPAGRLLWTTDKTSG